MLFKILDYKLFNGDIVGLNDLILKLFDMLDAGPVRLLCGGKAAFLDAFAFIADPIVPLLVSFEYTGRFWHLIYHSSEPFCK